ncbi:MULTISPECIES: DEAD/DEAH box helicase family protein [Streptococcus]|uniref:TOTE conflict system archaeo-eukaryotic primase domain-containing protein n=1 Tax=Streptococcus TaxID=1301 RepID=UPI00021B02CA|nr:MULTISPECIES: DEAD/DEAH box helicase family protein [Streptococcus]AEL10049.1 DNA or RNA helicases of superfamily II [Streptococcus pseudopneumoniae IS7493]EID27970.1 type III restriction enzyme, res subunit [Streptococcus pseudopneumoniae ATCC BAA-960 = CCUG 49455]EID69602.1 type III restriction enzyme, res subunit [Streptococcus pseudopneumoniae SK674]ETD92832.1 DEAD/DEAH box helicase [Streptococcus pseudopneumoniae 1321]OOR85739.1 DEAD/DEAH box helicase [Streptococcus pseudopneumoniae]
MAVFVSLDGIVVEVLDVFSSFNGDSEFFLCKRLKDKSQFVMERSRFEEMFQLQSSHLTTQEKLQLFTSVFAGRFDVYAKSFINDQGKIQYFPSYDYGWKQLSPEKRSFQTLTDSVLKSHFRGETAIGIFPMHLDDSCYFLVLDLDEGDWKEAGLTIRRIARERQMEAHLEISRSGHGLHIWFFFEEAIPSREARLFGKKLLELAMQESMQLSFDSFDRMFPNQDVLPKGGFGNLIALPFQGEAYHQGRTVFVDEQFQPYEDQWRYLQEIQRVSTAKVALLIQEELGKEELDKELKVVLSNMIQLEKSSVTPKTLFFLKNMASFSNPEFYLKQAMRQPTYQIPERMYLFGESDHYLWLPRGLLYPLQDKFNTLRKSLQTTSASPCRTQVLPTASFLVCSLIFIEYEQGSVEDRRKVQRSIRVEFKGELTFEQELALSDMTSKENGLLHAETGFGKTVLGAALISERKTKTIILVHNRQLLDQWLDRLKCFLTFEEEEATRYTPSGRERVIGYVGQYGGTKKWLSGLVDVVMIQSLFKLENSQSLLDEYEMMIVDECHHVSALMFEKVVAQFRGKYLYGLTATPERKNGHEPIVFQRIGEILHTADKRETDFKRQLQLRFTSFGHLEIEKTKASNFIQLSDWIATDSVRNQLIIKDILDQVAEGRNILVLVNRIQQIDVFEKLLKEKEVDDCYIISGKTKVRDRTSLMETLEQLDKGFVLLSTGKYIGEGFDLPQLDTLILAAPFSWKNNLIQYAGRIHRNYKDKSLVRIFDYVDIHVPYLEKMFQKRQVAYRKMDYRVIEGEEKQFVYVDSRYEKVLREDLAGERQECLLILPYVHQTKLMNFLKEFRISQIEICIPETVANKAWLDQLKSQKIKVSFTQSKIVTPILLVNKTIVWYGAMPLLGKVDEMTILRLESASIASELVAGLR